MEKAFLEDQKRKVAEYLEQSSELDADEKKKIGIVSQYISSLLEPESFTSDESEDIRKLALEFEYEQDTDFAEWLKNQISSRTSD
jgi:hypothetical protein